MLIIQCFIVMPSASEHSEMLSEMLFQKYKLQYHSHLANEYNTKRYKAELLFLKHDGSHAQQVSHFT
jgi:hypothetical protein